MSDKCVIGIDIGGTNSRIGAVNMQGNLLHSSVTASAELAEGEPERAIADLAAYIRSYIDENVFMDIAGLAIGFPATLDARRGVLYSASNLGKNAKSRFDGLHIPRELQKYFDFPVYMGKDTDFILYNDVHELGIRTEEMITGIYFGTGIGSSFMYRGETIWGHNGVTGEIGHLPISDNRRKCTCGKYQGCCETVASGWRLVQIRDEYFPDTPLPDLFTEHGREEVVQNYVFDIARVIALTGNLLDSAYTVIGGGIVNMKDFPKEKLREYVLDMLRSPYPHDGFQMLFSKNGQNAGILGAAQFLFHRQSRL